MNNTMQNVAGKPAGLANDLVTYASWLAVAACGAEIFYIFQHQRDLLGGFGLVQEHKDAISLLKFYGLSGAVAFSLASHKYIKLTAAGLALFAIVGMYGTQFHLKAERAFDTANLPAVSTASLTGNASLKDTPAPKAQTDTAVSTKAEISTIVTEAKAAGYTQLGPIPAQGMAWCKQDADEDGISNATDTDFGGMATGYDHVAARFNCVTGVRWRKAGEQ